jgi:hypothetical protein
VAARIATPIATFAQRGPGGTPGIAIDFIEAEHAAAPRDEGPGPNPGNASPPSTTRTAWPACWTGCGRQARTSRPPR